MGAERRRPMRSGLHLVGAFLAGSLLVTVVLLGLPHQGGLPGRQLLHGGLQPPAALQSQLQPQPAAQQNQQTQEEGTLAAAQAQGEQQASQPRPEKQPVAKELEKWRQPVQLPWPAVLSELQLKRGLAYYGGGQRVERLAAALMAGQPITAVVIGGSVSRGAGSTRPDRAFPAMFFSFLNASFPHPQHAFLNKAIGGTTSGIFATCAEKLVPPETDLVVVEFTFNEPGDAPFIFPHRRGFEQLLRKVARLPRAPAVIVLHHYAWHFSDGDGLKAGLFYRAAEMQLSTMAQYYDMPSPSLRNALYKAMQSNVPPFKINKVHKAGSVTPAGVTLKPAGAEKADYVYYDNIHPSDTGHQALAELLAGVVQTAVKNVAETAGREAATGGSSPVLDSLRRGSASGSTSATVPTKAAKLPPPMIPGNAAHATTLCAMQEEFQSVAVAMDGFEWRPERPEAADFVSQKWGYRGDKTGSWVELELSTEEAPGRRGVATVILGYLRSYQGMGLARVTCAAGCSCKPGLVDGLWRQHTSLMQMTSLQVSQHPRCRLRVTIVPRPGQAGGEAGNKFQLTAVMVAHTPVVLSSYDRQAADLGKLPEPSFTMVSSDKLSKLVALPTIIPALLLGLLLFTQWRSTACSFKEAPRGSGLLVCRQLLLGWELQTALVKVERREGWLWGRKQVDHWVLVDAGQADTLLFGGHASSLVRAVKRALAPARRGAPPGRLDAIVLTHAHAVGALPKLLRAYPDAVVVAHADERGYLVGAPPEASVNGTATATMRVAQVLGLLPSLGPEGIPPDRVLALQVDGGDLADAASYEASPAAKQLRKRLGWLPRGLLRFCKTGVHTPGSIAVVHEPSGTMLVGDAVAPAGSWWGGRPGLGVEPYASTEAAGAQKAAAKRLILQGGFSWLLPLHGGNFSLQRAQELVQAWPDEWPLHKEAAGEQGEGAAATQDEDSTEPSEGVADTAAAGLGLSPGGGAATGRQAVEGGEAAGAGDGGSTGSEL
ncbi:hypothetical protein C2E21_4783 [Chlorella sorokiniana]|uniref:Metallo-beta-lactamase domain-containing protein n=1 Tax=Chlorella sorokiniana TaxID=3076 RepID=A0A2P6TRP4_CHLSO|nr:hypothetical protein C2E21_4783 [Chlorella sorokiniana]|eukprot:PRW56718.1 hypothetical protein C2E21_4783 [Chlorella sorokiniana]